MDFKISKSEHSKLNMSFQKKKVLTHSFLPGMFPKGSQLSLSRFGTVVMNNERSFISEYS